MKEALIMGLTIALDIGIIFLYVFGDSQLVIRQLTGIYEVRKPELLPYFEKAKQLMSRFSFIKLSYVPRRHKKQADALANLAAALTIPFFWKESQGGRGRKACSSTDTRTPARNS